MKETTSPIQYATLLCSESDYIEAGNYKAEEALRASEEDNEQKGFELGMGGIATLVALFVGILALAFYCLYVDPCSFGFHSAKKKPAADETILKPDPKEEKWKIKV